MKKIITIAALTSIVGISQAATEELTPYVSFGGGLSLVNDADWSMAGASGDFSVDNGMVFNAAIGNALTEEPVRVELEYMYQKNDLDKGSRNGMIVSFPIDGDLTMHAVMANYYYDFENDSAFTPFLKAGIGLANVDGDLDGDSYDDTVFAYQFGAGVGYAASDAVTLDFKYNFLSMQDLDFDGLDVEVATHQFAVGIRYSF